MIDFTHGNTTKQLILFSLPMLLGNVFQQVYNLVDAMVVGRFVGGGPLAAVGSCGVIMHFMLAIIMGLTLGASTLISQFYGAEQTDNLKRTVSTSLIFLVGLVVVISALGIALAGPLLRMLSTPADIFADTMLYLRISLAGMLFTMLFNMYTAYLRALGDTRTPLYILMVTTVLNIVLDLYFVIGLGLAVAGVAWATVIAQGVSALLCILYVWKRSELLHIRKLVFDRQLCGAVLKYSVPAAVQLSLTSFANLTIMRLVNSFGSVAAAGYTAAIKIDQFVMLPLSNLSAATSTFTAQNAGAGLMPRAKRGLRSSMLIMCTVAVVLSLVVIVFGGTLVRQFVDVSEAHFDEIVGIGAQHLSILAVFYILFAIFFSFNGFFRGVGDAVIVMILTITSLSIRTLCAHALVSFAGFGVEAVAWSIPVGWGLCGAFCFLYYRRGWWRGKLAMKPKNEA